MALTPTYLFQKLISHEINLLFLPLDFFSPFFTEKNLPLAQMACLSSSYYRFDMVYNGVLSCCRAWCIRGGHGGVCAGCLSLQERSGRSASGERGTTTGSVYSKCKYVNLLQTSKLCTSAQVRFLIKSRTVIFPLWTKISVFCWLSKRINKLRKMGGGGDTSPIH